MILLQIVIARPGTHLVKNHESLSRTNESQFKKTRCHAWVFMQPDMYRLFGDRHQNSLLQFTEIKIWSYTFKAQKRPLNSSHRNCMNRIFYQKIFKLINLFGINFPHRKKWLKYFLHSRFFTFHSKTIRNLQYS